MTSFGTSLAGTGGGTFGVPAVVGVGGIMAKTLGALTLSGAGAVTTPEEGEVDLYPLYTPLDRNSIYFHADAGAWGDAVPLVAPTLPTITTESNAATASAFNTAAAIAGRRITITGSWTDNVAITASDVEVILPVGRAIGAIQIGDFSHRTIRRVRIRGSEDGLTHGGRCGQIRDYINIISSGTIVEDVVLDGVDINGASTYGGGETNQAFRVSLTRMAVLHCRVIAPGYTWLGDATHVLIADSNFYHGGATRAAAGFVEGWGIRNGAGPFVIVDSRIQGTRYHNFRVASHGNAGELAYIARSTLVAVAEGRTAWLWNNLGNAPLGSGQGAVIDDCDIYSYTVGGCGFGAEISATSCDYSRVQNCVFHSGGSAVMTQAALDAQAGSQTGDHDYSVGNSFVAIDDAGDLPAWAGPGDPTAVPLPGGLTLITGEAPCTSI